MIFIKEPGSGGGGGGGGVDPDDVIVITTTPYNVAATDLDKVFIIDQVGAFVVNLPAGTALLVGSIFELHKRGAGNVTINANGADTLADGTTVSNTVAAQTYAVIRLRLIETTHWSFLNGLGSWITT